MDHLIPPPGKNFSPTADLLTPSQSSGVTPGPTRARPRGTRRRATHPGLVDVPPDVGHDLGVVPPGQDGVQGVLLDGLEQAGGVAQPQQPRPAAGQPLHQVIHGHVGRGTAQHLPGTNAALAPLRAPKGWSRGIHAGRSREREANVLLLGINSITGNSLPALQHVCRVPSERQT